MLLDLYVHTYAGVDVPLHSASIASHAEPTEVWNHISSLKLHGLIELTRERSDKREIQLKLTPSGEAIMNEYLEEDIGKSGETHFPNAPFSQASASFSKGNSRDTNDSGAQDSYASPDSGNPPPLGGAVC